MKTRLFVLVVSLLVADRLPAAEPVSAQLQRALFDEEANQDLDAAITAYQSILNAHEEERKLTATALFRLGECYRKLGRTNDAVVQYQRLLRDFSDQNNLVRLSEQHLATLGRPRGADTGANTAVRQPSSPRERKLIEEQIALTERQLASIREAIDKGVQAIDADMPYRQAVARLRRELALAEEPSSREHQQKWLEEEIRLQEKVVNRAKQLIINGMAPAGSEIEPQKELLGLKRKLAALEAGVNEVGLPPNKPAAEGTVASEPKPDPEGATIKALEALLKDSPDVINAPDENPQLHRAVSESKSRVVQFLLEHGAEVDLKDKWGQTALHRAAEAGLRAIAELLLEHNANPNLKNNNTQTPLMLAAANGHKSIVESLLTRGADISAANNEGQTALFMAVAGNKKEVTELLLANKADVNVRTRSDISILDKTVELGALNLVKLLLSRGAAINAKRRTGMTALVQAIAAGNEQLVEFFLSQHADANIRYEAKFLDGPDQPNPQGYQGINLRTQLTPLMLAAHDGNPSIARHLLKAGAEVNAVDGGGVTALHWAVKRDRKELVDFLLEAGAEPNTKDRLGLTPLWTAASLGRESVVRALLERGARPNLPDEIESPLSVAVRYRHKEVIELLLERGADLAAADQRGQTALDVAKAKQQVAVERGRNLPSIGEDELVALLRSRGASEFTPRKGFITYCRISHGVNFAIFFKGTNDFNQHTLMEFIATLYSQSSGRSDPSTTFPDLSNIRISRRDDNNGQIREIKVDLGALLSSDAARDVPLSWGDVVEIPEMDHRATETWPGFAGPDTEAITKLLSRQVEIRIKGETNQLTLNPPSVRPGVAFARNISPAPVAGSPAPPVAKSIQASGIAVSPNRALSGFWLRDVLYGANVLRVSSDTRRVKVKRTDPATKQLKEYLFDLSGNPSGRPGSDLWLQNGDIIEVPEKQ
jgi:ankyrin repeat protein